MARRRDLHDRFKDVGWYKKVSNETVIIGGGGGIGSYLTFFISRMGTKVHLYDFDIIEAHNIGGQLYSTNFINNEKTEAMYQICKDFCQTEIIRHGKYEETSLVAPIMLSGFDNMSARRLMFENWCRLPSRMLFIDGRMQTEDWQVFVVQKGQEEAYRATLFDDDDVEEQPCSAKATSHCGGSIASYMSAMYTNYMYNVSLNLAIRPVPFATFFSLSRADFKKYEDQHIYRKELEL